MYCVEWFVVKFKFKIVICMFVFKSLEIVLLLIEK